MTGERWAPIAGFETYYEVSDLGRVRRSAALPKRWHGLILALTINPQNGYLQVGLRKPGKPKLTFWVHRLVAQAFVEQPSPDLDEVNHEDGDKQNCRWDNLEWTDRTGNNTHKNRVLKAHHNRIEVILTDPAGLEIYTDNLSATCESLGLNRGGMCAVMRGARNRHKGYRARYA